MPRGTIGGPSLFLIFCYVVRSGSLYSYVARLGVFGCFRCHFESRFGISFCSFEASIRATGATVNCALQLNCPQTPKARVRFPGSVPEARFRTELWPYALRLLGQGLALPDRCSSELSFRTSFCQLEASIGAILSCPQTSMAGARPLASIAFFTGLSNISAARICECQ